MRETEMEIHDSWCTETWGNTRIAFRVREKIFEETTPFQTIEVYESYEHGRILALDGVIMLTERDEFTYHEMLAHVPLFRHPAPERVLIIGGGDGGTAREVLKHRTVKSVQVVEIDERVIVASKKFLPRTASSFEDSRVEVHCGEGYEFIRDTDERFDLVLVDSPDPIGPAAPLFSDDFFHAVPGVLRENGILVTQALSPFYNLPEQKKMLENLAGLFSIRRFFNSANLSYNGGAWSFLFASRTVDPLGDLRVGCDLSSFDLRYYTFEIHRAAFALPRFMLSGLDLEG